MNHGSHATTNRWLTAAASAAFLLVGAGGAAAQSPCGNSVTVSLGDTLNEIAANCETTVRALLRANPGITDPDVIHVGQVITIPDGDGDPPTPPDRTPPEPSPSEPAPPGDPGAETHTVSAGETLARIAGRYGTSVSALVRANAEITDPDLIHVGQVITLPGAAPPDEPPPPERRRVQSSITPASGPPGTRVRMTASGFPGGAEVRFGSGRARSEYDLTGTTRADGSGRVDVTIPLPEYADPGERWVFVLVTGDRAVQSLSDEFRVTPDGQEPGEEEVQVTGILTGEGVECPALRGDDGALYTLAGDIGDFGPGDRVHVHGRVAEVSFCQQGTTIEIESISGVR